MESLFYPPFPLLCARPHPLQIVTSLWANPVPYLIETLENDGSVDGDGIKLIFQTPAKERNVSESCHFRRL